MACPRPKSVQNPSKMRKSKSLIFYDWLGLDEGCQHSRAASFATEFPMGWLEGFNRRSGCAKPLTSLPGADRACWKIFFEICWEAEIDDQIRRKIRARKNRKSLKNKTSPNCHRTFVWLSPRALAAENTPQRLHSSLAVASSTPTCSFSRYTWSSEIDEKSELEKVENREKFKFHKTTAEYSYDVPACSGRRKYDVTTH